MRSKDTSRLSKKNHYLQVAFNSTLEDARGIISILPPSERIIIEAGTPLIKQYGMDAIRSLRLWWQMRLLTGGTGNIAQAPSIQTFTDVAAMFAQSMNKQTPLNNALSSVSPYIVADMKTMDRGRAEVEMAAEAGASGIIALGSAPIETLNASIAACEEFGVDAMIDMMNVEFPVGVLRALKKQPRVVVLHRGVDEERDNREKMLPLHEIRRVKGAYDTLIAVAGGDTAREIQSAAFNDANIVVIWKSVFEQNAQTLDIVNTFLKQIK